MPMWAHYSNNHQGFCVAYDMKNPENTKLAGCTFPVQYTNERLDITDYMKNYVKMVLSEIDKQTSGFVFILAKTSGIALSNEVLFG